MLLALLICVAPAAFIRNRKGRLGYGFAIAYALVVVAVAVLLQWVQVFSAGLADPSLLGRVLWYSLIAGAIGFATLVWQSSPLDGTHS